MSGESTLKRGNKRADKAGKQPMPASLVTTIVAGVVALGAVAVVQLNKPSTAGPAASPAESLPSSGGSISATNDVIADSRANPGDGTIERSSNHLKRGNELLSQGKIAEAVAEYRTAVKLSPDDEDMHYNLALGLAKAGQREEAKAEYLAALKLFPDYAEAHNNLGNLLVSEGKVDEGIGHIREAIKNTPDSASAHNNLGNAYARQGNYLDALPELLTAIRISPDYLEAHQNLGATYLSLGRIQEAIAEFSAILKTHPGFEPAKAGLARARQHLSH